MKKLIASCCLLLSVNVFAGEDPCLSPDIPLKWQKQLEHPLTYTTPAIYLQNDNARVLLPVSNIRPENMNESRSYLLGAKKHILDALGNLDKAAVVDYESLFIPLEGLSGEELQVAIHVMHGLNQMIEHGLLSKLAAVEVNGKLVSTSTVSYRTGKDPDPTHGLSFFHSVKIKHQDNILYKNLLV